MGNFLFKYRKGSHHIGTALSPYLFLIIFFQIYFCVPFVPFSYIYFTRMLTTLQGGTVSVTPFGVSFTSS